ncbi:LCP family protein [Arsenicicoccus dermatophilus]|uniref:LCP family protein n=1 Tax=Arsenicicoccus dermatophilus TaxID=1076331 RepID=UPI00391748B2
MAAAGLAVPPVYAWHLHQTVSHNVKHASLMPVAHKPKVATAGESINLLVVATNDAHTGAGSFTIAHISADRRRVDLVILPREVLEPTFESKGSSGAVVKAEDTLGIRIDDVTELDLSDIRDLVDGVGGVTIDGRQMDGPTALAYLREGDLAKGRRDEQRHLKFMKSVLGKALGSKNPIIIDRFTKLASQKVTLDNGTTVNEAEALMQSLMDAQIHTTYLSNRGRFQALQQHLQHDSMESFTK